MKKVLLPLLLICSIAFSCKKSNDTNPVTPAEDKYMSMDSGNVWGYERYDSTTTTTTNYTLTSSNRDTTVNGSQYHVFVNSNGANQYYRISGNDYYQLMSLPAPINIVEDLYLKDNAAVSASWTGLSTTVPVTIPGFPGPINVTVTAVHTITETELTRTVNSISYSHVIHVKTVINATGTGIPAGLIMSDINSYYAKKYGMIETSTVITSSAAPQLDTHTRTILKTKNF